MMNLRYVPVNDETLSRYLAIMVEGNTILKSYHDRLKDQFKCRVMLKGAIFSKVDQAKPVRFGKVVVRKADLTKILAVRAIEVCMLEAFAGMIHKWANVWRKGCSESMEDIQQEVATVVLSAIYHYTDPDIKFITYATNAIRNRMSSKANLGGLIVIPDASSNRVLLKRYNQAACELNRRTTFSEVCEYMGLDEPTVNLLRDLLVNVHNESEIRRSIFYRNLNGRLLNDYTVMSSPVPVAPHINRPGYYRYGNNEDNSNVEACYGMLDALQTLVSQADEMLDDWERAVLHAALDGEYGWQAKVAAAHTNKMTGRPYTRQNVRWVMKRLGERIKSIARGDNLSKIA